LSYLKQHYPKNIDLRTYIKQLIVRKLKIIHKRVAQRNFFS